MEPLLVNGSESRNPESRLARTGVDLPQTLPGSSPKHSARLASLAGVWLVRGKGALDPKICLCAELLTDKNKDQGLILVRLAQISVINCTSEDRGKFQNAQGWR